VTACCPLGKARDYAHSRGLCGDIGPYRHLCVQPAGHDGQHVGVIQEDIDTGHVTASWGNTPEMMCRTQPGG
jgi:hypothetical protein